MGIINKLYFHDNQECSVYKLAFTVVFILNISSFTAVVMICYLSVEIFACFSFRKQSNYP